MDRKQHWEEVYRSRSPREVSWHQAVPEPSLEMIESAAGGCRAPVIDIGGGASVLVDYLLDRGFDDVTVLDISRAALELARKRLGPRAAGVHWVEADVTRYTPERTFAVWHDRAAFHFLTDAGDRQRYIGVLRKALPAGGHAIIGTFALDGPSRCSGLAVVRYDAAGLAAELGAGFEQREERRVTHVTPAGREQHFSFHRLERVG